VPVRSPPPCISPVSSHIISFLTLWNQSTGSPAPWDSFWPPAQYDDSPGTLGSARQFVGLAGRPIAFCVRPGIVRAWAHLRPSGHKRANADQLMRFLIRLIPQDTQPTPQ